MALVVGTNCGLVTVAPTSDPIGSGRYTIDNYGRAIKITTTDAITISEVGWWCDTATEESNFEIGLYSHDAVNNRPGTLLQVERTNAKGASAGWKKKSGLSWSLNASTIYWLAVQLDDTSTISYVDYQTGATGERYSYNSSLSTLPSTWTATGTADNTVLAIYGVYSAVSEELGTSGESSLYIKDSGGDWNEYIDYEYFKVVKKQNQVSEFEISIANIEDTDKLIVKEFAEVLFFSEINKVLKGRIQKVTYETSYSCKAIGFGMEAKLLDKEFAENSNSTAEWSDDKRAQYTNISAQTIAKELLSTNSNGSSPWIMQSNTTGLFDTDYGNVSIRYEYANRLKALAALTESLIDPTYQINYDWWVSQSNDYGTDYFNIAPLRPTITRATVSQQTFAITGADANCSETFFEKDITNLANKIECYDNKTEVLTRKGFKFFKDVTFDDEIATLNPITHELEYHKPLAKQEYDFHGKMHHYKNAGVDLLVTPEHSLYCKKLNDKKFKRTISKEIFGRWINFKKDCKWKGKKEEFFYLPEIKNSWECGKNSYRIEIYPEKKIPMNLWLEFLGWFISEGNLHKNIRAGYKIRITQNYPNLKKIIKLVKQLGYKSFICKNPDRIEFYDKQLYLYLKQFGKAGDKFVPSFIKELSPKQIKIFLEAIFEGDGTHNKKNELSCYYSKSKKLIEDVSELLLKIGLGFKFNLRRKDSYSLTVNHQHLKCTVNKKHQTIENYQGKIYDLTVPNHIMFIRRNNLSLWSGNCLGYGDGINQIHTSTYNASPIYSTLVSDITSSSTTITLVDASSFASSGEIRIMEERITYSGKSGNNLTGCARGANSTTAREHKKGVYVEKYVSISSPEADSSIYNNGLMDYSVTDRGLLDLPTAESIASKLLLEKMTAITSIRVIPDEPLQVAGDLDVGDLVTVEDSEAGISGDYRIVGMTYISDYGNLEMELELSNKTLNFIDQVTSAKEETEKLSKYMQGATNIYAINESENCDDTHYLNLRFFVPNEAVAINKVLLNFKLKDFRAYNSANESESTHTHTITITTEPSDATSLFVVGFSGSTLYSGFSSGSVPSTSIGSAHTHGITYGIYEESLINPSVSLYTGSDGGSMTLKGTYTTDQTEINVTNEMAAVGAGNWVNLQFRPNKRMRIEADTYIQIFIRSR